MEVIVLVARLLFALALLLLGYDNVTDPAAKAPKAEKAGVPAAKLLVPAAGAMLVLGCLSIALGLYAQIGALLVLLFLVPVTATMHAYWKIDDPQGRRGQRIHFYKNVALIGGALLILAYGAGPLSLAE